MANIQTETITRFQFRRGSTSAREAVIFQPGEPAWDIDQQTLYIGSQNNAGGNLCIKLNSSEFDTSNIATGGVSLNYTGFTSNFDNYIKTTSDDISFFQTTLSNSLDYGTFTTNFDSYVTTTTDDISFFQTTLSNSLDYDQFSNNFTNHLTSNPNDPSVQVFNNTITQGVATSIASDPTMAEGIMVPATDTSLGGIIVGDGLSATSDGRTSLKLGPGLTISEDGDVVVPDLGPSFTTGPGGSIVLDTSAAARNWTLYVNSFNEPINGDGDDLSFERTTRIDNPGPNASTIVEQEFASVMGAYLYAMRYLPPSCNLSIFIVARDQNGDETPWNHPTSSTLVSTATANLVASAAAGEPASEDDQWNVQLAFPNPVTDERWEFFDSLLLSVGFADSRYVHECIVTVETGSYIWIRDNIPMPLAQALPSGNQPGWGGGGILFWNAGLSRDRNYTGMNWVFDFDGATDSSGNSVNGVNSIIRFDGGRHVLYDCGITIRNNPPFLNRIFECHASPDVYFIRNLRVDVSNYDLDTLLMTAAGSTIAQVQWFMNNNTPETHLIFKTNDTSYSTISARWHDSDITVQFLAFNPDTNQANPGIFAGRRMVWDPGVRMSVHCSFRDVVHALSAADDYIQDNPLTVTDNSVTGVATGGVAWSGIQ